MINETEAAQFVLLEVRTRFQWPLTNQQSYDWARNVRLCKDLHQAKQIILEMVDEGKLSADRGVTVFRAKLFALNPPPPPPPPADYAQFKGAAAKVRDALIASGDARMKAVFDEVDRIRAGRTAEWKPLREDEQQRRKAQIISQLNVLESVQLVGSEGDHQS